MKKESLPESERSLSELLEALAAWNPDEYIRGEEEGQKQLLVTQCRKRFGNKSASALAEVIEPLRSVVGLTKIGCCLVEGDNADGVLALARALRGGKMRTMSFREEFFPNFLRAHEERTLGRLLGQRNLLLAQCRTRFGKEREKALAQILKPVWLSAKLINVGRCLVECDNADEVLECARTRSRGRPLTPAAAEKRFPKFMERFGAEAREKGRKEGLVEGHKEFLVDQCERRYGKQAASVLAEIIDPLQSLATLQSIIYRLVECESADEFLDHARAA